MKIAYFDHGTYKTDVRPVEDDYVAQEGETVIDGDTMPDVGTRPYTPAELNAPILAQLAEIDDKKTRAMTDALLNNDKTRLAALEAEAATLRGQLVK